MFSRYERLDAITCYMHAMACWKAAGFRVRLVSPLRSGETALLPASAILTEHRVIRYRWKFMRLVGALQRKWPRASDLYSHYYILGARLSCRRSESQLLVALDPPGLVAAAGLSRRNGTPLVYWPQELYFNDPLWAQQERRHIGKAAAIIGFDENRNNILRSWIGKIDAPMLTIPNGPLRNHQPERRDFWHRRFGLAPDARVVLFTGSVDGGYNLLRETIDTLPAWPADAVLVVHSVSADASMNNIAAYVYRKNLNRRVMLCNENAPFDELPDLYGSADVGLALYARSSRNHWQAGLSSGKTLLCLSCGVPVLVNDIPLLQTAIADARAGCCVAEPGQIPEALLRILDDLEGYRANASRAFQRIATAEAHQRLVETLRALVTPPGTPSR